MDKISGWIEKLKNFKHLRIIACAAVLVTILTVYFVCASCSDKAVGTITTSVTVESGDYCTSMRAQVEKIVSEISGVGAASVVINWDRSTTQSAFGNAATENPKALGALIVCDGGGSTKVKLDVIYAVSTLLDLSIEKIIVYPKSK